MMDKKLWNKIFRENKLNESEYPLYHNTYTDAVDTGLKYAKKKGYEPDEDDIWSQISTGPRKPSDGKTNRFSIALTKNGKEQKKHLQMQITGIGKRYELNAYIS